MRLLVIRTSAMGDVALTLPAIKEMNEQYPGAEIVMVTRKSFSPFFGAAKNVRLFTPDFTGRHKGIKGVFTLSKDLRKTGRFDYVIDLHDVLRSRLLSLLFRVRRVPVKRIEKGRSQKRALIKGKDKTQLKHSAERYRDVFRKAGFNLVSSEGPWLKPTHADFDRASAITAINGGINIGVAPFAKHILKFWPEDYMVSLLNMISEKYDAHCLLFGGKDEMEKLNSLHLKVPGSFIVSGRLTLGEEIAVISKLDFMISMDSSNMHIAALAGTKVISIWGATDPLAGFGAWNQPDDYALRIPVEELTCRPCTVYGKGKCRRHDHACMQWLTPEKVFERIMELGVI